MALDVFTLPAARSRPYRQLIKSTIQTRVATRSSLPHRRIKRLCKISRHLEQRSPSYRYLKNYVKPPRAHPIPRAKTPGNLNRRCAAKYLWCGAARLSDRINMTPVTELIATHNVSHQFGHRQVADAPFALKPRLITGIQVDEHTQCADLYLPLAICPSRIRGDT